MLNIPMHFFLLLLLLCAFFSLVIRSQEDVEINRSQFPSKFFFGSSTSSYQIEGAVREDGRGPNNWDVFINTPENILNGQNADVAADHYHRYEEDIEAMHSLGINAYRFSISWTRILPRGRFGDVNKKGIMFYNKIIDKLLEKGIEPFVTICHQEVPQELEDRYGSWLSPRIQDDFAYYADICFRSFGDRVKYWITINEPNIVAPNAYMRGLFPPGRCSVPFGNCSAGDSVAKQGGYTTILPHSAMFIPFSDDKADREAANRALGFDAAWILDPVLYGHYPPEMQQILGDRLPKFSPKEFNMVTDSVDYIGLNHYYTLYAKDCIQSTCDSGGTAIEGFVYTTGERNGIPIGERTAYYNFAVVPDGFEKTIQYLKTRYNNKPMFVLENGMSQADLPNKLQNDLLDDTQRVEYHKSYLAALARAIRNGADVRGYFVWSLIDNFEWIFGYSLRYGLYHVDYQTMKRTPKLSAMWYRNFLTNTTEN